MVHNTLRLLSFSLFKTLQNRRKSSPFPRKHNILVFTVHMAYCLTINERFSWGASCAFVWLLQPMSLVNKQDFKIHDPLLGKALVPCGKQGSCVRNVFSMRTFNKQLLPCKGLITHYDPEMSKHSASGLLKWAHNAQMPFHSYTDLKFTLSSHSSTRKKICSLTSSVCFVCNQNTKLKLERHIKVIWSTSLLPKRMAN